MATQTTEREFIWQTHSLRIWSQDDQHWGAQWSFDGRHDLQGKGWVAVVTHYDPDTKYRFERKFVAAGTRIIAKSDRPIVVEYRDLYDGGSKYAYDRGSKRSGWLLIEPTGVVRTITAEDAIMILTAWVAAAAKPQRMTVRALRVAIKALPPDAEIEVVLPAPVSATTTAT